MAAVEEVVSTETIILSNTSSLCITELAAATRRPVIPLMQRDR